MTNACLKEFAVEIEKMSRTTVQKTDEEMSGKKPHRVVRQRRGL